MLSPGTQKEAGVEQTLLLLTATSRGVFECRALEDTMRLPGKGFSSGTAHENRRRSKMLQEARERMYEKHLYL